jgi:nitrile hydratase subunit beta
MMDSVHDLGGRQGFGPIDTGEPDEPFHAPWEARLLGMARAMSRPAGWTIDRFRYVRESIAPTDYLTRRYYDQWLQTYAALMIDSGIATVAELASGKAASKPEGLAPPMPADAVAKAKRAMTRYDRPSDAAAKFAVGDAVVTLRNGAPGHTRLPQYARGRTGRIEHYHGAHVLPDRNVDGEGYAEALYTVSFAATELWPDSKGRNDRVHLDLWESYLARA